MKSNGRDTEEYGCSKTTAAAHKVLTLTCLFTWTDSVTSEDTHRSQRGVGRRGVLAGVATCERSERGV